MKLVPRAKFQPKTRDFEPDSFVQYRLEVKNHVFTIFPELLSSPVSAKEEGKMRQTESMQTNYRQ